MSGSPDGRVSTDGSCFECLSPDSKLSGNGWGVWIKGPTNTSGSFSYQWLHVPPPPAPPNYVRTTPASSGASDNASANPVVFQSPGQGHVAPNAGQPISVSGSAGSTANTAVDVARKVVGQVPGTSVVFNSPG